MINPVRGDVELEIRGVKVTLAPEMARFATLSKALGTNSLPTVLEQISGIEPYTMYACVDAFAKEGDVRALKENLLTFNDLTKVSQAMNKIVNALDVEPKNVGSEAAKS